MKLSLSWLLKAAARPPRARRQHNGCLVRTEESFAAFMHHLIYYSYATAPFDEAQLQALLAQSRAANEREGLTGILLYGNERFLQLLEGEEPDVRATYARIYRDPRHRNIALYADKSITARAFPEWQMAYHALDSEQFMQLAGYVKPDDLRLERPGLSLADTHLLQLMRTFVLPQQ